ncbi:MAG: CHAT domain-containing protein [Alphaproteobacteria bacterium]|nr:CHAT domain-containing protein [Alphaproteobacteria bacterium]
MIPEKGQEYVLMLRHKSACNTASADGTPGAEGLSGLAKAFFYAGSQSLLVSHWSVLSEAGRT